MLVKIHSRGGGGGSGPTGYLMSSHDHAGKERSVAPVVLRGNVTHTRELIDSLSFSRRYTSGCLSFSEPNLPQAQKEEIMSRFEACLFPSMEKDQYQTLWIEHRDKGRLELNFVIPNVELASGKRLQPYWDKADRLRVDSWQTLINDKLSLSDPHDPERARAFTIPSNLPKRRIEAVKVITEGLLTLEPQNRSEVITALNEGGFNVVRETKKSISIADPEGGRNLRLSGGIYDQAYRGGEELCREREKAKEAYRTGRTERIQEAQRCYRKGIGIRTEHLQQRYAAPKAQDRSLADVRDDSNDRLVQLRDGHSLMVHADQQPSHRSRRNTQEREPVGAVHRSQRQQSMVQDQGGQLSDRARASAIESIEEAGRRAEQRTRTHRTATATHQSANTISRTVSLAIDVGQRAIERLTTNLKEAYQTIRKTKSHSQGMNR